MLGDTDPRRPSDAVRQPDHVADHIDDRLDDGPDDGADERKGEDDIQYR
jgi:hypothetical protein